MFDFLYFAWNFLGIVVLVIFCLGFVSLAVAYISDWLQTALKPNPLIRPDVLLSLEHSNNSDDMPRGKLSPGFSGVTMSEVDSAGNLHDKLNKLVQPKIITALEAITLKRDELKSLQAAYSVIEDAQLPFSEQTHDELKTLIGVRISDIQSTIKALQQGIDNEYNI